MAIATLLNPFHILAQSSKLTLAGLLGAALSFAVSLFVARTLGPDLYGAVMFVGLWLSYASLVHPGFFEGGVREMLDQLGRGERTTARHAQNVAFTAELAWSAIPAGLLLALALFMPDPIRRVGFLVAPATFLGTTLNRMLAGLQYAHQQFGVCARVNAMRSLGGALILAGLVFWQGAMGYFLAIAAGEWLGVALYVSLAPSLRLQLQEDRHEAWRLLRIGLPLGLGGLVYWAYRLTGQTSVAAWLPLRDLAYYGLSVGIVNTLLRVFGDFSGVLMPALWRAMGESGSAQNLVAETSKVSLFLAVVTGAVANLGQAAFGPLVWWLFPRYLPAIPIFDVLALNLVVLTLTQVPSLVLDSATVNRQWLHLGIWTVALPVNLGVNYLALRAGWGLLGVAWNDIWVQVAVAVVLYGAAQQYLFPSNQEAWRLYGWLTVVSTCCVALFFGLTISTNLVLAGTTKGMTLLLVGGRTVVVAILWVAVGCYALRTSFHRTSEPLCAEVGMGSTSD